MIRDGERVFGRDTRSLCTLLAVAILAGCGWAKYEEVSHLPAYAGSIGKKYRTLSRLELLGITRDTNSRPVIDYFLLMGRPNIAGREVVERSPLPAGSLIEIVRISRCTNCAYSSIRFEVRISPKEALENKPVYVDNRFTLLVAGEDATTVLNPEVFELMSN